MTESAAAGSETSVLVRFEPAGVEVRVAAGTTILEAADSAGVDILTGCQRGMCGTDPVRIAAGQDGLAAPAAHERATLERMGCGPDQRLSCSARVAHGAVMVLLDGV